MIKSNLLTLLKTFSPQEFKEFGEFVSSPYHNKNSKVTALYNVIKKCYPDLESTSLEREKVFNRIYHGEEFRDSTLRLLMFYLYECARQFLLFKKITKDTIYSNIMLAYDMIDRDMLREAEKIINESYEMINKLNLKDENYFWYKYLNDSEKLALHDKLYAGRYEKYMTSGVIAEQAKNLTDSYLLRILRLYTTVLNINTMYKTNFDLKYFKNIISAYTIDYYKDTPLLEMYFYTSCMLENPDREENYFRLKELLFKAQEDMGGETLTDLFINLENYCVRKGRSGIKKFDKELFEIYKIEIDMKIYMHGKYMLPYFYKSATATALMVNEFEWAEKFVEDYKKELVPEYRESSYFHCLSRIHIAKKNYDKALECLSKVKSDEIYLKTETKLLFAYIYYELGIDDSLSSLLDTMRHFFKNDRFMADDRKNFYWDFIKILNKLSAAKFKSSPAGLFEIKELINSKEKLFLKNWLLEKANELENNAGS